MRLVRMLGLHVVVFLLAAGGTIVGLLVFDVPVPFPFGCGLCNLSSHRCEAIVEAMAQQLGVDPDDADRIELLGDPGCGGGPAVLCTRTMSFIVRVRFTMPDGSMPEQSVFCGVGAQYSILCTEDPEIGTSTVTGGGYRDVPCSGEGPGGCPTPVPTIDPEAARDASPLLIDVLEIPLDHIGPYEVVLGRATLPNGILTEASFTLADPRPDTFSVSAEGIRLRVRSLKPGGGDLVNVYEHGWRPGVEPVEVSLVFEVLGVRPGAVLEIRGVVVR